MGVGVSGVVLAGGRGRRLGHQRKADIVVGAIDTQPATLLEAVVGCLRSITGDIIVVGGFQDAVAGVRLTHDRIEGAGPLGGIEAGLAVASHAIAVVLGCDMPFVPPDLLQFLAERAAVIFPPGRACALVPRTRRGIEPLCAVYSVECREVIARTAASGVRRVSGLLAEVDVTYVEEDEILKFGLPEDLFFNVNTERELEIARARWNDRGRDIR